jgi:hypothetical protein
MNQLMQGVVEGGFVQQGKEGGVSFSFPLMEYGKLTYVISWTKKLYEKSVLRDFKNVLMASV